MFFLTGAEGVWFVIMVNFEGAAMYEERHKDATPLRMLFIRQVAYEYAVEVRPGLRIQFNGKDEVRVSVPTYADKYDSYEFKVEPEILEPRGGDLTVVEKIALRFKEAARRGTDVDLRFCSGEERLRRPEHDNLRPEYGVRKEDLTI